MMSDRVIVGERRAALEKPLHELQPAVGRGEATKDALSMGRIAPVIEGVGRDFAGAVDWLPGRCSYVDGCLRLSITENDTGLHEGGYIRLSAAPLENTLRVTGGCYDSYFRPVTVCEKSLPLGRVNERALGEVLMETHDKLIRYYRTHVS
jgi:hypothetical protein